MKIYCSGIGGIGLSAYAAYQHAAGHEVLGSDRSDSDTIRDLRSQGIDVFLEQDGSHVPTDCDLFVYSEAIPSTSPERVQARDCNIPQRSYFHALGELTAEKFVIAVSGTHGKSSTTAMIAKILVDAERDPSVIVGTKMEGLQEDAPARNWRKGESDIMVVEACEYRRSFHYLSPDMVVITNVDGDHFDAYESIEDYRAAFTTFAKRLPLTGSLFVHAGDADVQDVAAKSERPTVQVDDSVDVEVGVAGEHMRQNARLALAVALKLSIPEDVARESLKAFTGTWRRMQKKGVTSKGTPVIDDYAHHPVEIKATLQAIREQYPKRTLICVFQPHTHDRTLALYDDFISAFTLADTVIIPDVYNARADIETDMVDVTTFVQDIARSSNVNAQDGRGLEHTAEVVQRIAEPNDVIVTMGAGSIVQLAETLVQK